MTRPIEDRSIEFLLVHSKDAALPDLNSLLGIDFARCHWREAFDGVKEKNWQEVWDLKNALNDIDYDTYLSVRNRLFSLATSGPSWSNAFSNRAGYKLMECMEATGIWLHLRAHSKLRGYNKNKKLQNSFVRRLVFVDVCGGPGAFSQTLLAIGAKQGFRKIKGYGMTLAGVEGLDWYPVLSRAAFTPTYGLDGTGDIYKLANIDALASMSSETLLCVADGGFHVDFSIVNYQEAISSRILFSQWLVAVKTLQTFGCLVLKLFDTTLTFTKSLLFLSTFLFNSVHIVKPKHSRVVNSERYLVCIDYKGVADKPNWMAYFEHVLERGFVDNDHIPELIPESWMSSDESFMQSVGEMVQIISSNQKIALQMIIDEVANENKKNSITAEADLASVSVEGA